MVLVGGVNLPVFALDPVAPKSERNKGHVMVTTPLPESDTCEVIGKNGLAKDFQKSFKPEDIVQIPIGDYQLKVKLQENEWTTDITVKPTELTRVVVTGYGNLKVNVSQPDPEDEAKVFSSDKLIKTFDPAKTITLPEGTYSVKIKPKKAKKKEITIENVKIITNTTRGVEVSF